MGKIITYRLVMVGLILVIVLGAGWEVLQISAWPRKVKIEELKGEYDEKEKVAIFNNQEIPVPAETLAFLPEATVLGEISGGEKRIEIDLAKQRLLAFERDVLIYSFLISSGKWGRTPKGIFDIWGKFRYTKMEGGSKALRTYYYLPNVPFVMFFANDEIPKRRGFSLHGTYWHDNFGTPMSHGCINMKTEEAAKIYSWARPSLFDRRSILATTDNPGTKVIIYGDHRAERDQDSGG